MFVLLSSTRVLISTAIVTRSVSIARLLKDCAIIYFTSCHCSHSNPSARWETSIESWISIPIKLSRSVCSVNSKCQQCRKCVWHRRVDPGVTKQRSSAYITTAAALLQGSSTCASLDNFVLIRSVLLWTGLCLLTLEWVQVPSFVPPLLFVLRALICLSRTPLSAPPSYDAWGVILG